MRFEFYKPHHKLQAVIDWVNQIRAAYKIGPPLEDLPKGIPGRSDRCPIAIALSDGGPARVSSYVATLPGGKSVNLPSRVSAFIRSFDHGDYREYKG